MFMDRLLLESQLETSVVSLDHPAGNDISSDVSGSSRIVNAD